MHTSVIPFRKRNGWHDFLLFRDDTAWEIDVNIGDNALTAAIALMNEYNLNPNKTWHFTQPHPPCILIEVESDGGFERLTRIPANENVLGWYRIFDAAVLHDWTLAYDDTAMPKGNTAFEWLDNEPIGWHDRNGPTPEISWRLIYEKINDNDITTRLSKMTLKSEKGELMIQFDKKLQNQRDASLKLTSIICGNIGNVPIIVRRNNFVSMLITAPDDIELRIMRYFTRPPDNILSISWKGIEIWSK